MWFFPVLGFALEEKLCGAKCCKFYRPEGVYTVKDMEEEMTEKHVKFMINEQEGC